MKKRINCILQNPLISASTIIFIGSNLSNFFNFLFNLFMVRNLSTSDYGTLASLISLLTLLTIPAGSVAPTIVRFAASFFAQSDLSMVRGLYFKVTKLALCLGFPVFIIFSIFHQGIAKFFNISNDSLMILVGFMFFISFLAIGNAPLLQAKLVFTFITISNLFGSFLKLFLGLVLVYLGFSIWGAMLAVFFSFLIPYLFSFWELRFLFKPNTQNIKINTKELVVYGAPAAMAFFSLVSLTSTDILLVKHFFQPQLAGLYAGTSLLAKIIFFLTAPISSVMFPLIVQKHTRKENYHNEFKMAFILVLLPSVFLTVLYFLFPEFIIKISSKQVYMQAAPLLGVFGIFITVYALLTVLTNFYLSIKKTQVWIPITLAAIVQALLLWFFHKTFLQIILISLTIASLLLILLVLYYWRLYGERPKR